MKYFSIKEMSASGNAKTFGIDNTPNKEESEHIVETVEKLLDPLREVYGKPIRVTSGFRCKKLNSAVMGATTSSHMYGYAADIKPVNGNMEELQKVVLNWAKTHVYDQIIIEQPNKNGIASWLHVGWKHGVTKKQRKQILIAEKVIVNGTTKWRYSEYKG